MPAQSRGVRVRGRTLAALLLAIAAPAWALDGDAVNTGYFGDVAIKGYDPVAYFTEQRAVRGSERFEHQWLGARWLFASERHRELFEADPLRYSPQYGGHCADGVAYGGLTRNIDPEAWRIIEGKLYLNYDLGAAAEFEEVDGLMSKAEAQWPEIRERVLSKP